LRCRQDATSGDSTFESAGAATFGWIVPDWLRLSQRDEPLNVFGAEKVRQGKP